MIVKIRKWGNSLAMRFPQAIVKNLALQDGSEMELGLTADKKRRLVLEPTRPSLAELIAQITPENRPNQVDWGDPVGKEVW